MKKVEIKTLTPVHIGSGRNLMPDTEYIPFTEDIRYLAVIDESKIIQIIGEENIDRWIAIINNNERLIDYLIQRKHDLKKEDVSRRIITDFSQDNIKNRELKEQLHSARNFPILPGSSTKGAIRSALLAYFIKNKPYLLEKEHHLMGRKANYQDKYVNERIFGRTPNDDMLRFLYVGDVDYHCDTISIDMRLLNMYNKGWDLKNGNRQLVECIPADITGTTKMKLNKEKLLLDNTWFDTKILDWGNILKIINDHTIKLLEKEVHFWNEEVVNFQEFDNYMIHNIKNVLEIAQNCEYNQAVLRVGGYSGWDYITGSWIKDGWINRVVNDNTWKKIIKEARRGKDYPNMDVFPKTRKLDIEGDVTGFVKLTVNI